MTILQKINDDIKTFLKAGRKDRVSILRMVMAAATNYAIAEKKTLADLTDVDAILLLRREMKKLKETLEAINIPCTKETGELATLEEYLPKQWSPEALKMAVEAKIAELGATTLKDMGKVIKAISEAAKGAVEGKAVSDAVKGALTK